MPIREVAKWTSPQVSLARDEPTTRFGMRVLWKRVAGYAIEKTIFIVLFFNYYDNFESK